MLLSVENVSGGYGQLDVLHDLSLSVAKGERVGIFGPNGHGKTTLLRTISGLLRPRSGTILFDDKAITGSAPRDIVDDGLVHVAQGSKLFPHMTVEECLMLGAYAPRAWPRRHENLAMVLDLFPKLVTRRTQRCGTLSGGERQMVAIGMGLMGDPVLLMLDEPTLGLAPRLREELSMAIRKIVDSGVTSILVEQDIAILLNTCDRLCLLEQGTIRLDTATGQELDLPFIVELYFGQGQAALS